MSQFNMTKKKASSEEENDNTLIQIMTISLFIILLAFFILLNAIGVVDEKKKRIVVGSIVENFGGIEPEEQTTGHYPETVFTDGVSPVDFKGLVAGDDKRLKDVVIEGGRARTLLSVPENILFQTNRYRLTRQGRRFLKELSGVILENKFPVDITCHLDDVPVETVAGISARELTTLRSVRVLRYLNQAGRVSSGLMTASGWGSVKPKYSNKTAETRKMNRRVDFVFVHNKQDSKGPGFFIFKDFFFNVEN